MAAQLLADLGRLDEPGPGSRPASAWRSGWATRKLRESSSKRSTGSSEQRLHGKVAARGGCAGPEVAQWEGTDERRKTPPSGRGGAGITGLTTAYRISTARPDVEVVLLERAHRLGGNIRTERVEAFLIDAGPDAFLRTKVEAVELANELGLGPELMTSTARRVYVAHRGRLVEDAGGNGVGRAHPSRAAVHHPAGQLGQQTARRQRPGLARKAARSGGG